MKYTLTQSQVDAQKAIDSHNRCLIEKSIRSGKTLTILDYIKKNEYKSVLWLVPDSSTRDKGLPDEIRKWKFKLNITAICYNSLNKYSNKSFDLIVLDEVQMLSEARYEHLTTINYSKLIAMTGTISNKHEKLDILFHKLGLKLVYSYSTDKAVKNKDVAPYKINVIELPLRTTNDLVINYKDNKGVSKSFRSSEQKSYNNLSERIKMAVGKRKMMLAIERMRFLNTLETKIEYIKKYIANNIDKRILIFVATQEMAEQCSKYFFHGNSTDKWYNEFQKGKINHLVLVEKGATGHTYKNLDGCLLTTINSSNLLQQKIFRTILFREDYTANIDILISQDTVQKEWISKALENLDQTNIN
jgi:superfamily II DNA or RNA helicase